MCIVRLLRTYSFGVPNHPFSIPQSLDYEELNKLVNGIIGQFIIVLFLGQIVASTKVTCMYKVSSVTDNLF